MSLAPELLTTYVRQKYQVIGNHSAVKTCHWVRRALRTGERKFCYKQKFFGIRTIRCIQMTPSLGYCTQSCTFCWRALPLDLGIAWNQTAFPSERADEPEFIARKSVEAHRRALVGYGGEPSVAKELLELAMNPTHVAMSLEGEATLYPRLGELIEAYFELGFKTVFLVSNGTLPENLSSLSCEPSQLYISVCAPDEGTYERVCRPSLHNGWERLNQTLELINSFSCPTVMRITLVRGLNFEPVEAYARLATKAEPTYVEPKGAMALGYFTRRLPRSAMPSHSEVRFFAERLAELASYRIANESIDSRVVLLTRHG